MLTDFDKRVAVVNALHFKKTAKCPYYIWIHEEMVPPLAEHFGPDQFVITNGSIYMFAGSCTAMNEMTAQSVDDQGDCFVDEYGVTYRRGSTLHVECPALLESTIADYEFPDLTSIFL